MGGLAAGTAWLAACRRESSVKQAPGGALARHARYQPGGIWYSIDDYQIPDETSLAVPGGVFPSFIGQDIAASLDIYVDLDAGNLATTQGAYEYLVRQNRGPGIRIGTPESQKILPHLAESYEVSPDALTYIFKLRRGVKFQNVPPVNGREMDIEDWRASHERFMAQGYYRNTLRQVLDRVEFPDNQTMVYHMKEPYGYLLEKMFYWTHYAIMPRELHERGLARQVAIGTGYRMMERREPSVAVEMRSNPDYWKGKPFIERWRYTVIPEYANQYAQFVAGHIWSLPLTTRDALRARKDAPGAQLIVSDPVLGGGGTGILLLRATHFGRQRPPAPFNDERVRIAMRRAVDWEAITAVLANKAAFEAEGIRVPTTYATHVPAYPEFWLDPRKGELGEASKNYLYDVAEARKLIEAAGYTPPLEIDAFTSAGYTGQEADRLNLVVDQWHKSGLFKINLQRVPAQQWTMQYLVEFNYSGIIPASLHGGDMDYFLYNLYHSNGAQNGPWSDARIDALIEAQRREMDVNRRNEIIKEFQRYIATKFYNLIPADGEIPTYTAQWPWVRNLSYSATDGHLWWLAPDMPRRNG